MMSETDQRSSGLLHKYDVQRVDDPTGKHDGCRYFVLDRLAKRLANQGEAVEATWRLADGTAEADSDDPATVPWATLPCESCGQQVQEIDGGWYSVRDIRAGEKSGYDPLVCYGSSGGHSPAPAVIACWPRIRTSPLCLVCDCGRFHLGGVEFSVAQERWRWHYEDALQRRSASLPNGRPT